MPWRAEIVIALRTISTQHSIEEKLEMSISIWPVFHVDRTINRVHPPEAGLNMCEETCGAEYTIGQMR